MRRLLRLVPVLALAACARLFAQPPIPDSAAAQWQRDHEEAGRQFHVNLTTAAPAALSVDLTARAQSRAFFNAIFSASEGVPSGWTGSLSGTPGTSATGTPGTTSAAFQAATQLRINWYRAMGGIPAAIGIDSTESAMDQEAALMMSANNALSHTPPTSWLLYTSDGATAASMSNLALGQDGPDSISGYMLDDGSNNSAVGHRRWILYPQTQTMGTGSVDATGSFAAANATWVFDGNFGGTRPTTRDTFVAWPPPGFVPYQVVFPRWSFSYPGADFSAATVTMTSNGVSVPVSLETLDNPAYGENTIAWDYNGLDGNTVSTPAPQPSADLTYNVTVTGVAIGGQMQNFSYAVTLFDPAVAGPGDVPPSVSGSADPVAGQGSPYTVAGIPAFANGFQYRSVASGSAPQAFAAEGGLQGVIANVSGYTAVETSAPADGTGSYYLAMPDGTQQTLTLPGEFVASASASLQFMSELGYASDSQVAHVQISLDDGNSWTDLYTQTGTNSSGEVVPVNRSVSLSAYAGFAFEIRFAFTYAIGGSYFFQTTPPVGWVLDDISFSNVVTATPGATSAFTSGNSFSYTPPAAGADALEARSVLFGTYPVSWGPLLDLTVAASASPTPTPTPAPTPTPTPTAAPTPTPTPTPAGNPTPTPTQPATSAPVFTTQPISISVAGGRVALFALASNSPAYQWRRNGTTVAGATDPVLLIPDATTATGSYICVATNSQGSATSTAATVATISTANPGRLINLSCRAQVGTGADIMTAGFVVGGSGTSGTQSVLVRGTGPTLAAFSLTGLLPDPKLTLNNTSDTPNQVVASNTGWGGNAAIANEAALLGAFSWGTAATADSALLETLPAANYTAQISGASGDTGLALVEVYDATPSGTYTVTTPRLVNLSALIQVGSGANVVFAGFVIGGTSAKTMLIRASGPALAAPPFNFSGTLRDPQLTLTNTSASPNITVAVNTGWGADPEISAVANSVGAFQWSVSGTDSAILITLPPGNYTAGVKGASGDTGLSLIELYEVQ